MEDMLFASGLKACIEGAVCVEPGNAVSCHSAHGGELAPDEDLAVWLESNGIDQCHLQWG